MYPLIADLRNRNVLVVGAGKVAARKVKALLSAGARVTVVSPDAITEISALANAGDLAWKRRRFRTGDLKGMFLAVAATNAALVNSQVFRACERRQVLVNSVDDPSNCSFFVPATINRGKLTLAITTSGEAPYFARKLKELLDEILPTDLDSNIEKLGNIRRAVLKLATGAEETRSSLVRKALDPEIKRILEGFKQ